MEGKYIPFNDGYGIVGFEYECPKCKHITLFVTCDVGCEECGFTEPYVDPDDWYEEQLKPQIQKVKEWLINKLKNNLT